MWFIWECAGIICVIVTYLTVLIVTIGFLRLGVWDGLMKGDPWAYLHTFVFQYHCILIYISHVKCMTTEPGVLEKDHEELELSKMSPALINTVFAVKEELKRATLEPIEEVEIPKDLDISVTGMQNNLEESKHSWFEKLFGKPSKSLNDCTDLKILKEQRRKALEVNEKKMKMENMINLLSKIKMESLKHPPENTATNVKTDAHNIRFLSNLMTKSCKKCSSLKPPASHHCSVCQRCIARMDHHCPWVNTCVGFYNQKFFL
jgi:hypothetical protein